MECWLDLYDPSWLWLSFLNLVLTHKHKKKKKTLISRFNNSDKNSGNCFNDYWFQWTINQGLISASSGSVSLSQNHFRKRWKKRKKGDSNDPFLAQFRHMWWFRPMGNGHEQIVHVSVGLNTTNFVANHDKKATLGGCFSILISAGKLFQFKKLYNLYLKSILN